MSSLSSPPLDRSRFFDEIRTYPAFDVLVVGGGIAGVAALRDLSLQGLRGILVERADLASGASGALTRVAQGGFRYLEKGEIGLVSRAVTERNRFVATAPHQVRPIRVVLPSETLFGGAITAVSRFLRLSKGHSLPGAALIRGAVALYEYLGRRTRILPRGGFSSSADLARRHPGISARYRGAAHEFEGLVASPERVAVELAEDAVLAGSGSIVLNRTRIVAVDAEGVHLVDDIGGTAFAIRPRLVINAGGAGADAVARLFGVEVHLVDGVAGTHLLLRAPELAGALGDDLLFFEDAEPDPAKRRLCCTYAIGRDVLLGATEVPTTDPDASTASAAEEDYLLRSIRHLFPEIPVDRSAIVGHLHGVRPLAVAAEGDVTGRSRDHVVHTHTSPLLGVALVSIAGGKWTTFRAIGQDATDAALAALGRARRIGTEAIPIGGGRNWPQDEPARLERRRALTATVDLDEATADHLLATYGSRAERVAAHLVDPASRRRIGGTEVTVGEVRFFQREELAFRVDDVTRRRTRLYLTSAVTAEVEAEIAAILVEGASADDARNEMRQSATA